MPDARDVRVEINQVSDQQDHWVKVKWAVGINSHRPYTVKLDRLRECSKRTRAALQDLIEAARTKEQSKYPLLIRKLAEQGQELYKSLFFGISQHDKEDAERARGWVNEKLVPGQDTITFLVPSRIHIPWGLIYDVPVEADPLGLSFDHFWCVKFAVGTQYFDLPPDGVDTHWPVDDFRLLFGAHEDAWNKAQRALDHNEKTSLFDLLKHDQLPKFEIAELCSLWKLHKDKRPHGLVSLYCHASGTELLIGAQTLSALMFEQTFERREFAGTPPTFVFLAGCQTAVADLQEGFLEATSGPGYCGFIGTEARVPDLFTLRFLARFLDRFFTTESPVGDVMQQLRRENLPLSLALALCCSRHLTLRGADPNTVGRTSSNCTNLSFEEVSSV